MIIEELIPCISLIGLGLFLFKILSKNDSDFLFAEKIIYIIVLFSAIIIIPWSYFGIHKIIILFQLWPLVLALLGMLYLGVLLYQHYKKIIPFLEQANDSKNILLTKIHTYSLTKQIFIYSFIVGALLFIYTIFNLILSFRDFDAIWMYIPDAMWYYRMNYIPALNPLNFRVSTKEPFVSLLFSYTLYTTGSLNIKLLPILFVVGWSLTVYVFIQKIWSNQSKAFMGTILFILSPFLYYIFTFWVYYQEIYVSFFYSVTLLSLYNLLQYYNKPDQYRNEKIKYFYILIGILSFALSLLSKLSGWSLLFVILVIYPFPKKLKFVQSTIIGVFTLFLFFKVSTTYFIGLGLVLIFYYLVILYLLWKKPNQTDHTIYSTSKSSLTGLIIIPIGVIIGGFWLYDTLQKYQQYSTSFQDLYLVIHSLQLKMTFQGTPLNSSHFLLESAHSSDFIAIILYLLIGNMFVLLWVLPKLRVVLDDKVKYFVLWTLSFFMLWLTYQGFTSIRYLSVILVPVIIIVTHGFHKLYQDLVGPKKAVPFGLVALASFLAFTSYYYPISPTVLLNGIQTKTLNQQFLLSAFNYYTNSVLYLVLALTVSFAVIIFVKYTKTHQISISISNKEINTVLKAISIMIIIFIPFTVPSFVFISVGANTNDFNGVYNYYQRPAYTDIVDALLNENSPSSGILAIDMPGLPIYLNQPEIDLYVQGNEVPPLFTTNVTSLLQLLVNPIEFAQTNYNLNITSDIASNSFSFDYFIIPNYVNNVYKYYVTSLYDKSMLFSLLFQKSLFNLIHENSEFLLFKRVYINPIFSGIVNSYLVAGSTKTSVLGRVQQATTFYDNLSINILGSLPDSPANNMLINTTINGIQDNNNFSLEQSTNLTIDKNDTLFNYSIPVINSIQHHSSLTIANVTISIQLSGSNYFSTKTYVLSASTDGLKIQYDAVTNSWSLATGLGFQPI